MSTRSLIAYFRPTTNDYRVSYIHSDGYPSGVGATLLAHYTDPAKVDALFALGNLSCLGEELGERHDFDWMLKSMSANEDYTSRAEWNWTKAYHRDRGEALELQTGTNLKRLADDNDSEYIYLWDGTTWTCQAYVWRSGTSLAKNTPSKSVLRPIAIPA